ncbi:hypothetical protein [Paenibacillus silvisoli]|uniref:hypothetical protein n=1 Tax=Paenibacillus silvisoli TaxID=3110539 RepID=UPI002803D77E|nr:hypothetical protein [Paenibacillus silvisoli]
MRKMKRWKRVVLWVTSLIVVIGIAGAITANYAVNKVIGSLADSLESESILETSSVPPSDNNSNSKVTSDSEKEDETPSKENDNKKALIDEKSTDSASTSTKVEAVKENTSGYSPEVSVGKAKEVQKNISIKDKTAVTSILLSNLSLSDIKRLQQLAAGGVSNDEKNEARKIILSKVSAKEYNKLSQIAKSYGVSQGKTYDEVISQENNRK